MLNVCISFDYELFMGENYVSEEEVLLKPTEKISQMLKEHGVSGTFFADVCCPEAYRRLGKHEFADAFDRQLQFLAQNGHDVQLHIHPHWKKATQVGAKVEFPREAYRIHNWIEKDGSDAAVRQMVRDGIDYLNCVIIPVKPDYRCLAFRAGGYCLQPEKEFAGLLYQEGIRIDSSVCRGLAHDGDGMYYDYRTDPKRNNLYLSNAYGLTDNMEKRIPEGVFEVPVAGYNTFPFRIVASKLNCSVLSQKVNGYGMKLEQPQQMRRRTVVDRVKTAINATNMVTFDFYNDKSMAYMIKRIAKEEHCKKRDVFLSTIAHPKGQSDTHIENMKRTIEILQKTKNIRFVSMRQIADQLML